MVIHPELHLDRLASYFAGRKVLENGCGDGYRSVQIAKLCDSLVGIDPSAAAVAEARRVHAADNIVYEVGSATGLPFTSGLFDVVVFVLSLHHIPEDAMPRAIDEAIRVIKMDGRIIFIEPGFRGSFFVILDSNVLR